MKARTTRPAEPADAAPIRGTKARGTPPAQPSDAAPIRGTKARGTPPAKPADPSTSPAKPTVRQCFHCKAWIAEGEAHDCWTTTEAALTKDLAEDLRDAWERLRETAVDFGEQRIYASHHSIMFSRASCYFFVRPKAKYLEVCVFLDRAVKAPQIRRVTASSKARRAHLLRITHRDEVEAPITDWLREAYELQDAPRTSRKTVKRRAQRRRTRG